MNLFRRIGLIVLCLGADASLLASPLFGLEVPRAQRLVPGLGFEYFSRTLGWDIDPTTSDIRSMSPMKAVLGLFHLGYEARKGTLVGLLLGYSLTDLNGLVFRQLPFSMDYQAGHIGGFLAGAEIDQRLFTSGYFEIKATAQFVIYLGSTKKLEVTTLNTQGSVEAKPDDWMRVQIGPVLFYRGFEYFSPFLAVTFDKLWGKFSMTETIGDLKGSEEKSISSKSVVGISLGTLFEASPNFSLKAEGTILPYRKGAQQGWSFDYGGCLRAAFAF